MRRYLRFVSFHLLLASRVNRVIFDKTVNDDRITNYVILRVPKSIVIMYYVSYYYTEC